MVRSAWPRTRAAGAFQRRSLLLADRSEASVAKRTEWLKQVTFQKDLGSYFEKELRVQRVCSWLAETVMQGGLAIRPGVVHKADSSQRRISRRSW